MSTTIPKITDRSAVARQIVETLRTFTGDDVTEIRVLQTTSTGFKETHSGYFTDHKAASVALQAYLGEPQTNCFFVLNPVNPDLQARALNRIKCRSESTTKDEDILRRKWLFIDYDPKRATGISATDSEKEIARTTMMAVINWLRDEHGFPEPIIGDSGNGWHSNYAVNVPNDEPSRILIRGVINAIGAKFSDKNVKIDPEVFNASRICKLYGTWARKGDYSESRPHRQSCIVSTPETIEIVPIERLQAVSALAPAKPPNGKRKSGKSKLTNDAKRARAYVLKMDKAIQGENGSLDCFNVARELVRGFALSIDEAYPLLQEYSQSCVPPWSESEMRHKLQSAADSGGEVGYRLNDQTEAVVTDTGDSEETVNQSDTREPASEIDPKEDAEFFLQDECHHADGITLRFYRGSYWRWRNNRWSEVSADNVRAEVALYLGERYTKVSSRSISNVLEFVRALTIVQDATEMPCWLDSRAGYSIAFSNGIATLDDLILNKPECLRPHSPQWFSEVVLPYEFQPEASCETWMQVLITNLEADASRMDLVAEFVGYCLTKSTEYHAALALVGEGHNGKSVALAGITAILGKQNVSSLSLDELSEKFKSSRIVGKLANVCGDLSETTKVSEGVLKKMISGDALEFERKNQQPFSAIPTAKLIFATNTLPQFYDRSNGLWRRLIVMPFTRQVTETEKVTGMDQPEWWLKKDQLSGMFNWALAGIRQLRNNGAFTVSRVCQQALAVHKLECNHAATFLADGFEVARHDDGRINETEKSISRQSLYEWFAAYCKSSGYKQLGDTAFGKEVVKAFGPLETSRELDPFRGHNVRSRFYVGLKRIEVDKETSRPQ